MTVASSLATLDLSFPKNNSLNIDFTMNNAKSIAPVHFPLQWQIINFIH